MILFWHNKNTETVDFNLVFFRNLLMFSLCTNVNRACWERWYHHVRYVQWDVFWMDAADGDSFFFFFSFRKTFLSCWWNGVIVPGLHTHREMMVSVWLSVYYKVSSRCICFISLFYMLLFFYMCMHIWFMLQVHVGSHYLSHHLCSH